MTTDLSGHGTTVGFDVEDHVVIVDNFFVPVEQLDLQQSRNHRHM